ncbi:MAG: NAD-dependent epimerase [Gemmatimonadota bacterium]
MRVLVTGATGYIGGRVVGRLLGLGHEVRVLVRDRERALARTWGPHVEIVEGDLARPETLDAPLRGVDAAYYLVHSMYGGVDFEAQDRAAAHNFVAAARGVGQVIYLGGILPEGGSARRSAHLASRAEVGAILRAGLPTTEFRAGPIIGSGSASFEMVRYLTERLPAMVAPRWILNEVQPIGVGDVLDYLMGALGREDTRGVIDVGAEPVTFRQMMLTYADVRGLPRLIVPVPVLAPRLAALWVGLVTPIPNALAVPLVEGVVQPLVGDTSRARSLFPDIRPRPYRTTVERALRRIEEGDVATRWTSAGGDSSVRLVDREGIVREVRTRTVDAPQEAVFRAFSSLGGDRGWRCWDWAWKARGLLDQLVGGPGLRRGRRHPHQVYPGEAIDFWRVEEVRAPSLLRLRAEMKVPGKAWLQFEAVPEGRATRLVQTAYFAPTGFLGWAYWYGIYPLHALIFSDMVDAIAKDARVLAESSDVGAATAGTSSAGTHRRDPGA